MAVLSGTNSADVLVGTEFADLIEGLDGSDTIDGGQGDDTLTPGKGDDSVRGGDGDDWFRASPDYYDFYTPRATLDGGEGEDTYEIVNINILTHLTAHNNLDRIQSDNIVLTNIERFVMGNGGSNVSLSPYNRSVHVMGGAGNDNLSGSSVADTMSGGAGHDHLDSPVGADLLLGGEGHDSFSLTFRASANGATLDGGAGIDLLTAWSQSSIVVDMPKGRATSGNIVITITNIDKVTFQSANGTVRGIGDNRANSFSLVDWAADAQGDLDGAGGADTLLGGAVVDRLTGGAGNDLLNGFAGANTLTGDGGDDTFVGGLGHDTIAGGEGVDTLTFPETFSHIGSGAIVNLTSGQAQSGSGAMTLSSVENVIGTKFADHITGDAANNVLQGLSGLDVILGQAGDDTLSGAGTLVGGYGNDSLSTGGGRSRQSGGPGDDTLVGGAHEDQLDGGGENDWLRGGLGLDRLSGGDGADTLDGGENADVLAGGDGADVFVLSQHLSFYGRALWDRIVDFDASEGDRIDLTSIDAVKGGADDPFIWSTEFSGEAGQLRLVTLAGRITVLEGDTDGDGEADFAALLVGIVSVPPDTVLL